MRCARREAGARRPAPSTPAESPRRPEQRPGRSRARFSFLPALALLLGALSLFHAAPAEAQAPAAPTGLSVTPGGEELVLSWTASTGATAGYSVQYTSAPASGNGAVANSAAGISGSDHAAGWIDIGSFPTATAYTISSLPDGTAFRVRVRARGTGFSAWVFGSGTPLPTVTLSVSRTSVPAGESITLTATLSSAQTGFVTVNLGKQAGTAHTTKFQLGASSIFIPAGQTTGTDITILTNLNVESLGTFQVFISGLAPQTSGGVPIFNPVNGTPSSAPLTLTITAGENADLEALSATQAGSAGGSYSALTLSPSTFVAATTAYTATVPFATTHMKLRVRGEDESSGFVTGSLSHIPVALVQASLQDGTTVQKTSTSDLGGNVDFGPVALSVGENPITVRVTAQDGTTTKDYTVTVTRQPPPAPTNLAVSPGDQRLTVSWSPPPASVGTVTNHDVEYTSAPSATVSDTVAAVVDHTNPATGWVAALFGDGNTGSEYTIQHSDGSTPLINGTTYRVRVHYILDSANNFAVSDWAHTTGTPNPPTGTPNPPTVTLSAFPNPVDEGEDVTVTVTLESAPAADLTVPVTLTAGTAETGDYGTLASITVSAGQTTATGTITTTVDTDVDDETFTVALDKDATAALGYAPGPGDLYSHQILIKDQSALTLEISYGDQKLLVGPYGKLGDPTDTYKRYVQASPTMKRLTLKLSWPAGAIASDPTAVVYYYMPGVAGDTLTWGTGQNGTTKTLEMYSPLGTPGYPRVTLSAGGGIEYTIVFQNNGAWEFHHNNLLDRLEMTIPQGP